MKFKRYIKKLICKAVGHDYKEVYVYRMDNFATGRKQRVVTKVCNRCKRCIKVIEEVKDGDIRYAGL